MNSLDDYDEEGKGCSQLDSIISAEKSPSTAARAQTEDAFNSTHNAA